MGVSGCLIWGATGLPRPILIRGTVWGHKVRDVFPRLTSKPRDEAPFVREWRIALHNISWSSDLSRARKELYRELVVDSASDPLVERLDWSLGEICSQWNWAPGSSFLNNSEFSLTRRLSRNALALNDWAFRAWLKDMPDCLRCGG